MSQDLTRTRARPPRGPGPPASPATEPGSGRDLAALRPEPRARLPDPRAPPYPDPARVARLPPPPPGASASFKPSSPSPGRLVSPASLRSLPGGTGAVAFLAPPPTLHEGSGTEWASRFSSRNKEAVAAAAKRGESLARVPAQLRQAAPPTHAARAPTTRAPASLLPSPRLRLPPPARPRARARPPFRSLCARAGVRCAHARRSSGGSEGVGGSSCRTRS